MKKEVWVKAVPWNKKVVTTAIEGGADAVVVDESEIGRVKKLGRIPVVCPGGDIQPDVDFVTCTVRSASDVGKLISLAKTNRVIVETTDWHVIPLENLVSQSDNIMVAVATAREARLALNVLEVGVKGVVAETEDLAELKKILATARGTTERVNLTSAIVRGIRHVGMGDRVCVDTCSEIEPGAGLLVGNSSSCLFLVHAENIENPYVTPRPFRVNAGALHAYVMLPGGRTGYLSELKAGDEVLVTNFEGKTSVAVVGRTKIEKRPLLLVEIECAGENYSHIVQNAETIRFVKKNGSAVSVVELDEGDEILVSREEGGRHFGVKIKETIKEK